MKEVVGHMQSSVGELLGNSWVQAAEKAQEFGVMQALDAETLKPDMTRLPRAHYGVGHCRIGSRLVVAETGSEDATHYENINQNMATAAIPMAAVANQPTTRSRIEMMNFPMIFGLTAINIINPMMGTETTPLMTALQ